MAIASSLVFMHPAAGAVTYTSPPDPVPWQLHAGETLNVVDVLSTGYVGSAEPGSVINIKPGGGIYGAVVRGVMNVEPGASGMGSGTIDGGTLNANGGSFGIPSMMGGAIVNINGGRLASLNSRGGVVNFHSGALGSGFYINTTINIHAAVGAAFGSPQYTGQDSTLNLYGGPLTAVQGPALNFRGLVQLFMRNATVDGQPIPGLAPGQTATISARDVTLAGALQDGSTVNMFVSSNPTARFHIPANTTLLVTQVPEPSTLALIGVAALGLFARQLQFTSRGVPRIMPGNERGYFTK